MACLTTAIALTSAVGSFFSELTGGKIGYKTLVTTCSIFSAILAVSGVDNIIQFAYPPLAFVYPIAITLVLYIIIFGRFVKSKAPYIGALLATTLVAIINVGNIVGLWDEEQLNLFRRLPLFDMDLAWLIPSIIGFMIGLLLSKPVKA